MRVYIAGPISSDNIIDSLYNIRAGIKAAVEIVDAGHDPFCPFIDFLFFLVGNKLITEKQIKQYSINWLKQCDAMIVLDGWEHSDGTLDEMVEAKRNEITIYHGLRSFLDSH